MFNKKKAQSWWKSIDLRRAHICSLCSDIICVAKAETFDSAGKNPIYISVKMSPHQIYVEILRAAVLWDRWDTICLLRKKIFFSDSAEILKINLNKWNFVTKTAKSLFLFFLVLIFWTHRRCLWSSARLEMSGKSDLYAKSIDFLSSSNCFA